MYLIMAGIDFHTASADIREHFVFKESETENFLRELYGKEGVTGCAVLVTCNRTELYISVSECCKLDAGRVLLSWADINLDSKYIYCFEDYKAVKHLTEVSCGIHSQVVHEEQIVSQINQTIIFSRNLKVSDSVLDTLFRTAVSAGKYALANISFRGVPLSVSYEAIRRMEEKSGSIQGKRCVVIGNGKTGRITAELLLKKNCRVYITIRSCHHGDSIIPYGAVPVCYEERMKYIDGADIVISATRSPHYTVTSEQIRNLDKKPDWLIDLAMPRDIDIDCRNIENIKFMNLDDFNDGTGTDEKLLSALRETAEKYAEDFEEWINYRNAIPHIENLKKIVSDRILNSTSMDIYKDSEIIRQIVNETVNKSTDMIISSMKSEISPELVKKCCERIQSRARLTKRREQELT